MRRRTVGRPRRQLKQQLRRARITQDDIAEAAGVTRTAVCHVLAGRWGSAQIMTAIERLLAEQSTNGKVTVA